MSRPLRLRVTAATLLLVGGSVLSTAWAQDPEDQVEEQIRVFESRITLDISGLSERALRNLSPTDIVVVEDGAPREVTSLRPLREAGTWRSVVYIDAPLTRAQTIRTAALALGEYVESLAELGTVEIIIADPDPRQVLAPSQRAPLLEEALTRVASMALDTDILATNRKSFAEIELPTAEQASAAAAAEVAIIRRQADHLIRLGASGGGGNPTVLFLISDGYYEKPGAFYFGDDEPSARAADEAAGRISAEVAQTLAGYEWLAMVLPLRDKELSVGGGIRPTTDFDTFIEDTGGVRLLPKARDTQIDLSLDDLELQVSPVLRPLSRLAMETAGEAVRVRTRLGEAIERLLGRWRAYYLTDRALDGTLRSTSASFATSSSVRVIGGTETRRVRAPAWVRASTPATTVEARLRALLDARLEGDIALPMTVRLESTDLQVDIDWRQAAELAADSLVRASIAFRRPDGTLMVRHLLVEGVTDEASGVSTYRAALPRAIDSRPIAVIVEALRAGAWGAATIGEA